MDSCWLEVIFIACASDMNSSTRHQSPKDELSKSELGHSRTRHREKLESVPIWRLCWLPEAAAETLTNDHHHPLQPITTGRKRMLRRKGLSTWIPFCCVPPAVYYRCYFCFVSSFLGREDASKQLLTLCLSHNPLLVDLARKTPTD